MKAVKCPVCNGEGKIIDNSNYSTTANTPLQRTCHGCNGKGWVEVAESYKDYDFTDLNAVKGVK